MEYNGLYKQTFILFFLTYITFLTDQHQPAATS